MHDFLPSHPITPFHLILTTKAQINTLTSFPVSFPRLRVVPHISHAFSAAADHGHHPATSLLRHPVAVHGLVLREPSNIASRCLGTATWSNVFPIVHCLLLKHMVPCWQLVG